MKHGVTCQLTNVYLLISLGLFLNKLMLFDIYSNVSCCMSLKPKPKT